MCIRDIKGKSYILDGTHASRFLCTCIAHCYTYITLLFQLPFSVKRDLGLISKNNDISLSLVYLDLRIVT